MGDFDGTAPEQSEQYISASVVIYLYNNILVRRPYKIILVISYLPYRMPFLAGIFV